MKSRAIRLLGLAFFLPLTLWCQNTLVRFHTNLGDIDVALLGATAPKTVANFLNYMNKGAYNNSVIHRSVPGFIVQGGGYTLQNHMLTAIPADPAVVNEYSVSNTRGTLAMAKLGADPNSATNQWFFNLGDNSNNLNNQNGGFTVFGRIVNNAGLAVMDKIAAVPAPNPGPLASPFDQIPLINYSGGTPQDENYVLVTSITQLDNIPAPVIAPNGVGTPSSFGGVPAAAPGSYIEIYGTNLSGAARPWASADFKNTDAPTSLDGVSVTINNRSAYVAFISSMQVNVQVPASVPGSGQVPVVLTYNGQSSDPVMLTMKPVQPGILATPAFNVNGKQYVVAVHSKTNTLVSNGKSEGVPLAPAVAGETLIFYGVGFGPITPASVPIAGRIAPGMTDITTPLEFDFGGSPGQISFKGLAPNLVGVYQFNVTLPADTPSGDVPMKVLLGGAEIQQTLYLPVQN